MRSLPIPGRSWARTCLVVDDLLGEEDEDERPEGEETAPLGPARDSAHLAPTQQSLPAESGQ